MSKAQLDITQMKSTKGMEEKPHIISQPVIQTKSNQITDKFDQVRS